MDFSKSKFPSLASPDYDENSIIKAILDEFPDLATDDMFTADAIFFERLHDDLGQTIGFIYDQGVLPPGLVTDPSKNLDKQRIHVHTIAGNWDQATKDRRNKVDVIVKTPTDGVIAQIGKLSTQQDIAFKSTQQSLPIPDSLGVNELAIQGVFHVGNELLANNVIKCSVNNLCQALTAMLATTKAAKITKQQPMIPDAVLHSALKKHVFEADIRKYDLFSGQNTFARVDGKFIHPLVQAIKRFYLKHLGRSDDSVETITVIPLLYIAMFLFDLKRSGDFGQVDIVKRLNDAQPLGLVPYRFYDKDRKLMLNVPATVFRTFNQEGRFINPIPKFMLITGDRMCYMKARLDGVPTVFIKPRNNHVHLFLPTDMIGDDQLRKRLEDAHAKLVAETASLKAVVRAAPPLASASLLQQFNLSNFDQVVAATYSGDVKFVQRFDLHHISEKLSGSIVPEEYERFYSTWERLLDGVKSYNNAYIDLFHYIQVIVQQLASPSFVSTSILNLPDSVPSATDSDSTEERPLLIKELNMVSSNRTKVRTLSMLWDIVTNYDTAFMDYLKTDDRLSYIISKFETSMMGVCSSIFFLDGMEPAESFVEPSNVDEWIPAITGKGKVPSSATLLQKCSILVTYLRARVGSVTNMEGVQVELGNCLDYVRATKADLVAHGLPEKEANMRLDAIMDDLITSVEVLEKDIKHALDAIRRATKDAALTASQFATSMNGGTFLDPVFPLSVCLVCNALNVDVHKFDGSIARMFKSNVTYTVGMTKVQSTVKDLHRQLVALLISKRGSNVAKSSVDYTELADCFNSIYRLETERLTDCHAKLESVWNELSGDSSGGGSGGSGDNSPHGGRISAQTPRTQPKNTQPTNKVTKRHEAFKQYQLKAREEKLASQRGVLMTSLGDVQKKLVNIKSAIESEILPWAKDYIDDAKLMSDGMEYTIRSSSWFTQVAVLLRGHFTDYLLTKRYGAGAESALAHANLDGFSTQASYLSQRYYNYVLAKSLTHPGDGDLLWSQLFGSNNSADLDASIGFEMFLREDATIAAQCPLPPYYETLRKYVLAHTGDYAESLTAVLDELQRSFDATSDAQLNKWEAYIRVVWQAWHAFSSFGLTLDGAYDLLNNAKNQAISNGIIPPMDSSIHVVAGGGTLSPVKHRMRRHNTHLLHNTPLYSTENRNRIVTHNLARKLTKWGRRPS